MSNIYWLKKISLSLAESAINLIGLSQITILLKWLDIGSCKLIHSRPETVLFWYQSCWWNSHGVTLNKSAKCVNDDRQLSENISWFASRPSTFSICDVDWLYGRQWASDVPDWHQGQTCQCRWVIWMLCTCLYRVSSVAASHKAWCTAARVIRTAVLRRSVVTAASSVDSRNATKWECHAKVWYAASSSWVGFLAFIFMGFWHSFGHIACMA